MSKQVYRSWDILGYPKTYKPEALKNVGGRSAVDKNSKPSTLNPIKPCKPEALKNMGARSTLKRRLQHLGSEALLSVLLPGVPADSDLWRQIG